MNDADSRRAMDDAEQTLHPTTSNDSGISASDEAASSQPPSYKESMTRKILAAWNTSLAWIGSKGIVDPVSRIR
jgi:hypothetical protein